MHIYIYIYIYIVHFHAHTHTRAHIHLYIYIYIYISVCVHACVYVRENALYIYIYIRLCMQLRIYSANITERAFKDLVILFKCSSPNLFHVTPFAYIIDRSSNHHWFDVLENVFPVLTFWFLFVLLSALLQILSFIIKHSSF